MEYYTRTVDFCRWFNRNFFDDESLQCGEIAQFHDPTGDLWGIKAIVTKGPEGNNNNQSINQSFIHSFESDDDDDE